MQAVQILHTVKVRQDLAREKAEQIYRMKKDLNNPSPSKAPIIV